MTGERPVTLHMDGRRILVERNSLRFDDDVVVSTGPTPARLLAYLASNVDRIVPAEELLREVWQGAHVTTASLQRAVHVVRDAMPDEELARGIVTTVRGRGYRLGPNVEVIEEIAPARAPSFVGRDAPLARLLDVIERARSGQGQLVLVSGPAGIGKTRLLQELTARAPQRGFRVLSGRCPEQAGAAALWPWEEALREAGRLLPEALRGVPASDLATLRKAFPVLDEGAQGEAPTYGDPAAGRFRLFEAIRRALLECARVRPLVVMIDDIHRADPTSIELLEWTATRSTGDAIVLIASHRDLPAQWDPIHRDAIARLRRLGSTTVEPLSRLLREDVDALARAGVERDWTPEELESLWKRSAGNPFLVKTLVGAYRYGGSAQASSAVEPEDAVRHHVEQVSPSARRILARASIWGRDVHEERLAALSDERPDAIRAALGEASEVGLVETDARGQTHFVHALVTEALHASMEPRERSALHARACEILEREVPDDATLGALAEHAWEAREVLGGALAATYCERAARSALHRFAFEEAARLLERTLALSHDEPAARRLALLLLCGDSQARSGHVDAATQTLQRAIELATNEGDHASHARAVLTLGMMREDETEAVDQEWVRTLEDALDAHREPTALRARLLSRLSATMWGRPPHDRAATLALESVELARSCGDADTSAEVLIRAHRILQTGPGDDEIRTRTARELSSAVDAARDPTIQISARISLLWETLIVGDRPAFDEQVVRILESAKALDTPHARWWAAVASVSRAHLIGHLGHAEQLANETLAIGQSIGLPIARQNYALQMLSIRLDQGRLGELEDLFAPAAQNPFLPLGWRLSWCLARRAQGVPGPARELLREFCRTPDRLPRDSSQPVTVYLLADTAAELREVDTARVLLPLLEALRGRHAGVAMGYCHWGTMDRQRGRVLALLDRWDEAEAALEAGIEQARRFGAPAAVAHGQRDLGLLVLQRGGDGQKARALRLLEEALSLAEGIGMRDLEQSCREQLSAT